MNINMCQLQRDSVREGRRRISFVCILCKPRGVRKTVEKFSVVLLQTYVIHRSYYFWGNVLDFKDLREFHCIQFGQTVVVKFVSTTSVVRLIRLHLPRKITVSPTSEFVFLNLTRCKLWVSIFYEKERTTCVRSQNPIKLTVTSIIEEPQGNQTH